jgi:hypothetical protein
MSKKIDFAALHNCAKHIVHLAEAVEACLLVVDATRSHVEDRSFDKHAADTADNGLLTFQLKQSLQYRRSLFKSTKLRLTSLQKRIDNAITLSFNLVTQQDSMVMMQDSSSMKIIAAITMIFLPTTGVATVVGSQLFLTDRDGGTGDWQTHITPLFAWLWWVSIPLTVLVMMMAAIWGWWVHHEQPPKVVHMIKRAATFRSSTTADKGSINS